ncbi:MAG: penicillin-binding protein 2 [Sulfurovum sp.]|nr:MAG: penicillin-binding protein 2 [Sulfurovum sp.]
MEKRVTVKSEREEYRLFRSRAYAAAGFVLIALALVFVRLIYLQITNYDHYTELSRENYQKRVPIPPVRGLIYDRNGVLLADNHIEYVLDAKQDDIEDLDAELKRLMQLLPITPQDVYKFKQKQRVNSRFQPVILRKNLTDEEIATFSANRFRFPGFKVSVRMQRNYPLGSVAGHLLGYVGRIDKKDLETLDKKEYSGSTHIGKSGIEKFYETRLHGKAGYELKEVDAHGKPQIKLEDKAPIAGEDLFLSIDLELQIKAEELLKEYNGAAVAIDPRNGEILAMASMPAFDPNLFVNGISYRDYNSLRDNPDRPLYNRALQGAYPPGSTIKPMAALSGLNAGVITPSRSLFARGYFQIPGNKHRFRCWKKAGHGHISLNRAIYQSCDVYFYDLAFRMGIKRYSEAMKKFGFGQKTGIDLPHERSALMPSAEWKRKRYDKFWYPGDTVNTGIGQGYFTATPLQLAFATSIIANHGRKIRPHVLRATRVSRNLPEKLVTPERLPSLGVTNLSYWDDVIQGMVNVVHGAHGTARRSGTGAKYRFAGKTGTAQVYSIAQNKTYNASRLKKKLHDHALFVAFAPVENPKIALAIIAENAGGGSHYAAPIARQLLDTYLLSSERKKKKKKQPISKQNDYSPSLDNVNKLKNINKNTVIRP